MVNWGLVASWGGVVFSLASAIGYACVKDYRRALYFFFAFCITVVVIWR
jgi:hypothetical protein